MTSTIYGNNDKEKKDDDDNLPTIEDLLYTTLKKEGFAMEDSGLSHRVEEGAGSIDYSRSASGDSSSGSQGECALYPPLWN